LTSRSAPKRPLVALRGPVTATSKVPKEAPKASALEWPALTVPEPPRCRRAQAGMQEAKAEMQEGKAEMQEGRAEVQEGKAEAQEVQEERHEAEMQEGKAEMQ